MQADDPFPTVEGQYQITRTWSISLPDRFKRRVEGGDLIFWRPGLTARIAVWDKPASETKADRLAAVRTHISPAAFDAAEESAASGLLRLSYRLREGAAGKAAAFYSYVVGEGGHVQMAVYFDEEKDVEVARALWRSLKETKRPGQR